MALSLSLPLSTRDYSLDRVPYLPYLWYPFRYLWNGSDESAPPDPLDHWYPDPADLGLSHSKELVDDRCSFVNNSPEGTAKSSDSSLIITLQKLNSKFL